MARTRFLLSLPLMLTLSLFIGCSGDETAGTGEGEGGELGAAVDQLVDGAETLVGSKLDLTYVTADFSSAIIVHPARMLNSDFIDELVKAGLPLEEALKKPMEETGVDPRKIEQIMILLDNETASMAPMLLPFGGPPGGNPGGFGPGEEFELDVPATAPEPLEEEKVPDNSDQGSLGTPPGSLQTVAFQPGATLEEGFGDDPVGAHGDFGPEMAGPPMPTVIIRFSEPVDAQGFFGNMKGPRLEDAEVDGLKVKKTSFPEAVFHFTDSKTLIVTKPDYLKKIVETKSADSDLITELKTVDPSHDLIIVADLTPVRQQLQEASQMLMFFIPPGKEALGRIPTKTKMVTIAGGISHDSLLSLSFIMDSADDVTAVNAALTDGLKQGREMYEQQKSQGLPPSVPVSEAGQKELIGMADEIVAGISHKADGNRLTITIPKPGDFNKLVSLLKPAIDEAKKAAERAQQKNQLKQIGLAFHNYHDTYNAFTGAGSDASGAVKGLSWRVHLLPFLEEAALYDQFNLDEPWDSEHNKALISQMPELFKTPEVTEEGKTVFHVIVGEKTAFQMEKGHSFRDFTDGTSNTILALKAGPDKADIWTKPGGLEFDEEDPVGAFGEIPDLLQILMGDGSVRAISTIVIPETMKALITRNGGEVVGDF